MSATVRVSVGEHDVAFVVKLEVPIGHAEQERSAVAEPCEVTD
jgi:hypothetical protein